MTRAALIDAAFHDGPVFRMGFDAHVRRWRAHVSREVWKLYHTDDAFAHDYDMRRIRERMAA